MTSERLMHQLREILSSISTDRSQSNVGVAAALAKLILELGVSDKVSRFSILLIELVKAIIREVEAPVRRMLAEELATDSRASRGIVRALAEDDIDVAWPILVRSESLEDTDLIEIAIKGSVRHRLAIAQRELVEEVVSAAVMAFGEPEVAKTLLDNSGARISERTFGRIAALAKEWGELQPPLAGRSDLPAAIAIEMLDWAVESVHEKLFVALGGDKTKLRRIILSALDTEKIAEDVAESLRERLSASTGGGARMSEADLALVLNTLPDERRDLKELAVSEFLSEPLRIVRGAVRSGAPERFAMLCRAADISKRSFENICDQLGPASLFERSGWLLQATKSFQSMSVAQAQAAAASDARGS
jgi:uncharacterized protein (DUF2336 family)